jgi:hypothetical protein
VSAVPARLTAALDYAGRPEPVTFRRRAFAELLQQADQRQAVWLAVSLGDLGRVARMESRALDLVVRPLLEHTRELVGGLSAGDDLRAAFTFRAHNVEAASRLEVAIRSVVGLAEGAPLILGRDRDLLPLFQLLSTGETTRDATAVSLRCRLTTEQLPP